MTSHWIQYSTTFASQSQQYITLYSWIWWRSLSRPNPGIPPVPASVLFSISQWVMIMCPVFSLHAVNLINLLYHTGSWCMLQLLLIVGANHCHTGPTQIFVEGYGANVSCSAHTLLWCTFDFCCNLSVTYQCPRLQCEIRALFSVTGKLLVQAIGKLLS